MIFAKFVSESYKSYFPPLSHRKLVRNILQLPNKCFFAVCDQFARVLQGGADIFNDPITRESCFERFSISFDQVLVTGVGPSAMGYPPGSLDVKKNPKNEQISNSTYT